MRTMVVVAALVAAVALGSAAPVAAAQETCVDRAVCLVQDNGEFGEGSCDEGAPWYGKYRNARVRVPSVPELQVYTYAGCYDYGGTHSGSYLYGNVMFVDSSGQLIFYGNVAWSASEYPGGGACGVSYFTWDAYTGSSGWYRPCNVGPVNPGPPVGLLP